MSTLNITHYDRILFDLLPHLSGYKSYSGGEGAAYFIDDNFVVKEYTKNFLKRDPDLFDAIFNEYCTEIQNFSNQGFSVPKIYAWMKIPNLNTEKVRSGDEMEFKYYILEEKIPGRWIYYFHEDLEEMYNVCKNVCSEESFYKAIWIKEGNHKLRKEILMAYISDYLHMNQKLESMADDELEKFIISAYKMAFSGVYSGPDLFRKNVLVGDSRITLIDNRVRDEMFMDLDEIDDYFLVSLIDLIEYNKFLDNNLLLSLNDCSLYDESVEKLLTENRKVCLALTEKVMNILNKKMGLSPVKNEFIYSDIESMINGTFQDDAEQIIPLIQTEFDK